MNGKPLSLSLLKLFVNVWWWGMIALGAVAMVWIATQPASDFELAMVGYASDIDTSGLAATDHEGAPLGVEFDGPAKVKLVVTTGSLHEGYKLVGIILLGLILAACSYFVKQLRDIVRTIDQQEPFVSENVQRVRTLGLLIIGFAVAKCLTQLAISGYADSKVVPKGFSLDGHLEMPIGLLIAGTAVIVLSEVFRHGTRLRDEQSLTI
ncbi:MAG: DUF2975 domain-containing protein [Planctomycetota bacterium]